MWEVLQRVANIATVFLLITIASVIIINSKSSLESNHLSIRLEQYKEDNKKSLETNITYFESRINRLAVNQDSYQNGTATTLSMLEQRVRSLEAENKTQKTQQKIINNSTNNNLVNVQK